MAWRTNSKKLKRKQFWSNVRHILGIWAAALLLGCAIGAGVWAVNNVGR